MAMVEDILVAVFRFEYLSAMPRAVEAVAFIAMKYSCGKAFLHEITFSIDKVVGQLLCPTHFQLICVVAKVA